jgi:hypothetical protein
MSIRKDIDLPQPAANERAESSVPEPVPGAEVAPERPEPQQATAAAGPTNPIPETGPATESNEQPWPALPIDPTGPEMLDRVCEFIGQYLSCTDHQRTILALWILHTYCCASFQNTPYLDIRSAERESGKTICLQVLNLLCARPWMVTNASASVLSRKIAADRPTVLLDDWDTSFRSVDRQSVIAFLLSTSRNNASFIHEIKGQAPHLQPDDLFCPKAFAGNAPLPPALARRSIPLVLKRAKAGEKLEPFRRILAEFKTVPPLIQSMKTWAERNGFDVKMDQLGYARGRSMPGLSPHQQDCAGALLSLAARIQGDWPDKIWNALFCVFKASRHEHEGIGVQLLSDIRDAFAGCSNPDQLSTKDLLAFLHPLEHRSWNAWNRKPITPRALALILHDFEVVPRMMSPRSGLRGYRLKDFADSWKRYLPPAARKRVSSAAPREPVGKQEMQPAQPQELPPQFEREALQVCEPLAEPASIHAGGSDTAV